WALPADGAGTATGADDLKVTTEATASGPAAGGSVENRAASTTDGPDTGERNGTWAQGGPRRDRSAGTGRSRDPGPGRGRQCGPRARGAGRTPAERPRERREPTPTTRPKIEAPVLPDEATPELLDNEIRKELRGLPLGLAEVVARHLVAAAMFLDEDAPRALR